jgi:hypothetical protein
MKKHTHTHKKKRTFYSDLLGDLADVRDFRIHSALLEFFLSDKRCQSSSRDVEHPFDVRAARMQVLVLKKRRRRRRGALVRYHRGSRGDCAEAEAGENVHVIALG